MMNILILAVAFTAQTQEKYVEDQITLLVEQYKLYDLKVSIERRDAKVEDVIDDFRKQSKLNFILDSTRIPPEYRVKEFIIKDVPFKEALLQFFKLAELAIVEQTASIVKIERPVLTTMIFKDSDITEVIDAITKLSGANIMISPDVKNVPISISVTNVPWDIVLETVVRTAGFTTVREAYSIIRVVSPKELVKQMDTKIFKLTFLQPPPSYKAKIAESKYLQGGTLKGPGDVKEVNELFPVIKVIEATLTKDDQQKPLGSLHYDITSNTLVVKDIKPVLDKVEQIIKVMDAEPPQISLDVKFIFTTNTDLLSFGFDYFGGEGSTTAGFVLTSRPRSVVSGQPPEFYSTFPFGFNMNKTQYTQDRRYFLTQYEAKAIFRAFKQDLYSKVSQQPTLTVMDNNEATIFVGQEVPYAEITAVASQSGGTVQSITEGKRSPVKVGFQLMIIPRVVGDKILITVIPDNSVLVGKDTANPGFERFKISNQEIVLPRISQTTLVTRIMVEDSKTIILGGLTTENLSIEDHGVPILRDIPILNYFFRKKDETTAKEHLLIVITPRIVKASDKLTESLQELLKKREKDAEKYLDELKKLREDRNPLNQMENHLKEKEKEFEKIKNGK